MDTKNEFQELLDRLLKEQEEKLTRQFEKEKQALITQHEQREQEWSSLFEAQTQTVATVVADHIGKEVVSSYTAKFGADSEATQHAKEIPYQEHAQVAAQFLKADGQVMTADEFASKHTSTWDEFNAMGGVSSQAQELDQHAGNTDDQWDEDAYWARRAKADLDGEIWAAEQETNKAAMEAQKQAKAPVDQVEQPTTSQDEPTGSSITPEMLAAANRSSNEIAKEHAKLNEFKTIEQYSTMSRLDDRLDIKHLEKEMSQEKFNVTGKIGELVNYFGKVRHFDFGGKTADEHRAIAASKNDVKTWLESFAPAETYMKQSQASELKLMPFDASDKDIEQMKLKHKVEQEYFAYSEKSVLSNAKNLFKNEILPDVMRKTPAPTSSELAKLGNAFKDYVAHKLGKTWKHTYADPKKPRMTKDQIHAALVKNNEARTQKAISVTTTKTKTLGQIKSLRMSM